LSGNGRSAIGEFLESMMPTTNEEADRGRIFDVLVAMIYWQS